MVDYPTAVPADDLYYPDSENVCCKMTTLLRHPRLMTIPMGLLETGLNRKVVLFLRLLNTGNAFLALLGWDTVVPLF